MSSKTPSINVAAPTVPAAPTATATASDFASALPIYYSTALQYEPQMAALEKQINEQLYPSTAGLQETLAGQANDALTKSVPQWWQDNAQENLKSTLGRNMVYNPLAQEKYGVGLMQANEQYKNYYQNMALSLAQRQTLSGGANLTANYTPTAQMQSTNQNYGTYANAYGNMYNTNAQMANSQMNYTNPWVSAASGLAGNVTGSLSGGYFGGLGQKWAR